MFRAIDALAETDHAEPLSGVLSDTSRHFLVRTEAARALGKQRRTDLLMPHVGDSHDRVRQAVVRGLGTGTDGTALVVLERAFRKDANPDVRSAALSSIGTLSRKRGVTLSRTVLGKRDAGLVRRAASMLGNHGDLADVDRLRTMALRKTIRTGGMREAAKIIRRLHDNKGSTAAAERLTNSLIPLLGDLDLRARQTAVRVLGDVGTVTAIPHLEAFRRVETVSSLADAAREAVKDIRARDGKIDPLVNENETEATLENLEERIEELESKFETWQDKQ